jgi:hypothetical protein
MGTAHGAEELDLCSHGRACQAGVYVHFFKGKRHVVAVDAGLAGKPIGGTGLAPRHLVRCP